MPRVKRGKTSTQKRARLLRHTKGYRWGRKSKVRAAREAILHAWSHAFRGRKQEKRDARSLWNVKINAACRAEDMKYSSFIRSLKDKDIMLDRKVLSQIAEHEPETFKKIVEAVK